MEQQKLTSKEQLVFQKIREFLSLGEKITIRSLQIGLGYASPRSISVLIEQLTEKGWIYRDNRDLIQIAPQVQTDSVSVRSIPLLGMIACGTPIFAEENIETKIPVSTSMLSESQRYFFLRAKGDSMNQKGIDDGDLVLIRETSTAKNGDIVVALINDEATLKELCTEKGYIVLIPHSDNPVHKPIILDSSDGNIMIQGVFVRVFPGSLF